MNACSAERIESNEGGVAPSPLEEALAAGAGFDDNRSTE
jgi:hypothetical protein